MGIYVDSSIEGELKAIQVAIDNCAQECWTPSKLHTDCLSDVHMIKEYSTVFAWRFASTVHHINSVLLRWTNCDLKAISRLQN